MIRIWGHKELLEWPQFIERYSEKTSEDYSRYSAHVMADNLDFELEEQKMDMSDEEIAEAKKAIEELRTKYDDK